MRLRRPLLDVDEQAGDIHENERKREKIWMKTLLTMTTTKIRI